MATRNATNYTEFAAALSASVSGDIVFIPGNSVINMTGQTTRTIPAGVEIRGERGGPNPAGGVWLGGLISTTTDDATLLQTGGANCKIRLLRIQGGQPDTSNTGSGFNPGIRTTQNGLLVEWCEISGFRFAAIQVNYTNTSYRTIVQRCYMHHCQQNGLGYCITANNGYYIARFNKFDFYRHCVTGGGTLTNSAEITDNLILLSAGANATDNHSCDMHSMDGDNRSNPGRAGNLLIYDRNVFGPRLANPSYAHITVRGIPQDHLYIRDNKFWHNSIANALDCFGGETNNTYTTISGNTLSYTGPLVDPSDTSLYWGAPPPPPSDVICNMTAPASGTQYDAPASIPMTATASVSGGTITGVQFRNGTQNIGAGTLAAGVWSFTWTNVPAGAYNLNAVATDNLGNTGQSTSRSVSVSVPPPPPSGPTGWGFTRHEYISDKLANFIKRAPFLFKK